MVDYDKLEELFGLAKRSKKQKDVQVVDKLLEKPIRDKGKNAPQFVHKDVGITQQADLLHLPDDNGYKYSLVVVDQGGNRVTDAEPLKAKDASSVLKAFKAIYARKILKIPKVMQVDPGSEFKGVVAQWFADKGVAVRVGKTGRHRQQGLVERKNFTIGKALHRRMLAQETLTGETSKEWVEDLPKLVSVLNNRAKKAKPRTVEKFPAPTCEGSSCNTLSIGTKVRVIAEQPRDPITGAVLTGKFRASDVRWEIKERVIKQVLLKPGFPPLYLLDGTAGKIGVDPVAYTKNQLQVISKDEVYPKGKDVVRGKPTTYIIDHIVGKTRVKGKIFYRVKWRGYDEITLEPRTELIKDQPRLVQEFESR